MSLIDEDIAECEACGCVMDVTTMQPFTNVECPECGTHNRVKVDVGSYVLKKRQGLGGMSLVFGAVDKTLGREVAIKILNENYSKDAKRIEQFEQEAKITAAISHPNVVRVYTVGKAFQRFFIAMELVTGDSLEQKMRDEGALDEKDILSWGREVCEGLNAANEKGLIHRDIKPGNILFDSKGHVKIVDFGLALVTQGGKAKADEVWATPYYVPPETLDVKEEDFRSDMYALGASLYHAVSGKVPFENESRSTTELKQIKTNLPSLGKVAPGLGSETVKVIDKAMAFNADDRYGSYKEFMDALYRAELHLDKDHEPMPTLASAQGGMSGTALYTILAVTVLVIGGIIFAFNGDGKSDAGVEDVSEDVVMPDISGTNDSGESGRRLANTIKKSREALEVKAYGEASKFYTNVLTDGRYSVNSAMWAGLQGAITRWLNGDALGAKNVLRSANRRYNNAKNADELGEPSALTGKLIKHIPVLLKLKRTDSLGSFEVNDDVEAMFFYAAALKNWEEGYFDKANEMFELVNRYALFQGSKVSDELKVYVGLIADYKQDKLLMKPFVSPFIPENENEIAMRRLKLNEVKSKLRTKGRSVENVEEWLVQLKIYENKFEHERLLEIARAAKRVDVVTWEFLYKDTQEDISLAKYEPVVERLELIKFNNSDDQKKKEYYLYLCRKASSYINLLSQTIVPKSNNFNIVLKNGKTYSGVSKVDAKGLVLIGRRSTVNVSWGEISTVSVIDLLKKSLKSADVSAFERKLRVEQAIAYAWLGGERVKAKKAADNLMTQDPVFKKRWTECMKYLDK